MNSNVTYTWPRQHSKSFVGGIFALGCEDSILRKPANTQTEKAG